MRPRILLPLSILTTLVVIGLGIETISYGGPRMVTKLPVLALVGWAFLRGSDPTRDSDPGEG